MKRAALVASISAALMGGPIAAAAAQTTPAAAPASVTPVPRAQVTAAPLPAAKHVDVVLVLDLSRPMTRTVGVVGQRFWAIVDRLHRGTPDADIRMGLVAYRDGSNLFVADKMELTGDLAAVRARIIGYSLEGSGQWSSSVNQALSVAVNGMPWVRGDDSRRIVVLIGAAAPRTDVLESAPLGLTLKMAADRRLRVDTIQVGRIAGAEDTFRAIPAASGGYFLRISPSADLVTGPTSQDAAIADIQTRLAATVVPYGLATRRSAVAAEAAAIASMPPFDAADLASFGMRASTPAGRFVLPGDGDLVADMVAGRVDPAKVKPTALPDDLRAMTPVALKAYLEAHAAERRRLQDQLVAPIAARDAELSEAANRLTVPLKIGTDLLIGDLLRTEAGR